MAIENPTGRGANERLTTAEQDDRDQAAVLQQLLFIYPEPITRAELVREMTLAGTEPDWIERAIRDLAASGLLHRRDDDLLIPTRAAVRAFALFDR
ncbi:MAG: hypothetical protein ACJ76D_01615 [Solirubrobacterales bacterium]